MKRTSILLLSTLLFGTAHFTEVQGQTDESIQELYTDFLNEEDIFSKIDDDGDIVFKHEGKTLFISVNSNDALFFRMVLPNIWPIESEEERVRVLKAMDDVNKRIKVAKMYQSQENVWIAIEVYQRHEDDYEAFFDRSLRTIMRCIEYFKENMGVD